MAQIIKRIFTDKTFLFTAILALLSLSFGTVKTSDIDVKTLMALLSLIILISIFEVLGILKFFAGFIIEKCKNLRQIVLVVLLLSFFGSMFFTNDVAILTLIPIIFNINRKVKLPIISLISLTTIYANLGSAITPFGNPQNLYLVSFYHLKLFDFFMHSLPIGFISLLTLFFSSFFYSKVLISQLSQERFTIKKREFYLLGLTTFVVLLGLLNFLPIWSSLLASLGCAFFINKHIYKEVDYGIILTFLNFFIIVGALSRIPIIHNFITDLMQGETSIFFTSIGASQLISNVPAAVLLSKFIGHFTLIYLGVTIGGLGTLVASLANLLAFRQYQLYARASSPIKFLLYFTFLNILFLTIFILVGLGLL